MLEAIYSVDEVVNYPALPAALDVAFSSPVH